MHIFNSRKRKFALLVIAAVVLAVSYQLAVSFLSAKHVVECTIVAEKADVFQVFYINDRSGNDFEEAHSFKLPIEGKDTPQTFAVNMPSGKLTGLRIDTGEGHNVRVGIASIVLKNSYSRKQLTVEEIAENFEFSGLDRYEIEDGVLWLYTAADDPYLFTKDLKLDMQPDMKILALASSVIFIVIMCAGLVIISFADTRIFVRDILRNRRLIGELSWSDFRNRYVGSYFGFIWAFIQPIVTILIYVFVFQVGFRAGSVNDYPFVLWLTAGIVVWNYFQDALISSSIALVEYSYLVKKVVFNIDILPTVKIVSCLFMHLIFLLICIVIYFIYGYSLDKYLLQIFYYTLCTFSLVQVLALFNCSILLFFKDLGQVINITLQVGMWMTPIMWDYNVLPQNLQFVFKLNPVFYLVQGYRNAFLYKVWFWQEYRQTAYFWGVVLALFVIGSIAYRKLKPHFADVL